ncbi:hypothetical protein AVEN_241105-1 [Araneus ventricosus]|uniref:Uncharacterized protein n=1 Tax=Araneus ventricosus TaxID=182803 RepID=A0A4Y2BNF4_ARAVE|nr:hypothetical protein AVEN_241105-1 [Araneus ventricosus]
MIMTTSWSGTSLSKWPEQENLTIFLSYYCKKESAGMEFRWPQNHHHVKSKYLGTVNLARFVFHAHAQRPRMDGASGSPDSTVLPSGDSLKNLHPHATGHSGQINRDSVKNFRSMFTPLHIPCVYELNVTLVSTELTPLQ